ncbi:MAG: phosphate ABC transporter permease subunit PstC [Bacteroidia bacterium]|nr:phosphate ABC transporter permease subunit PstC [Bacteroidia bacterium]
MRLWFRKVGEAFLLGMIRASGAVSSLVVILIVVFLFKEGIGIVGETTVEEGFVLTVHRDNPVNDLTPIQVKDIFDQKITHWAEVGGKQDTIILLHLEDLASYYTEEQIGANLEGIPKCLQHFIDSVPQTLAFVPGNQLPHGYTGKIVHTPPVTAAGFLADREWFPTAQPSAQLGVMPLILGTLLVSLFAILFALPLGLATAIYMAEVADERIRRWLKPVIELLAGIPSVVYGFFGLVVVVPWVQELFGLPVGETALSGAIVLAIMALPTIITVSEDALRNTPRAMKEASLALGASHWQTIRRVTIPYSSSGITAGAILGIGRAIGETMAVLMVTGNAAVMPSGILEPVRTIPATIAAELGEAPFGGLHFKALFALGCILFILTLIINLLVESVSSKNKIRTR